MFIGNTAESLKKLSNQDASSADFLDLLLSQGREELGLDDQWLLGQLTLA